MQFRISFDEIQGLLFRHSSKHIQLQYVDTHTVRVAADVNVLFKTASVAIDITVDRIEGTDLLLSYSGGMGIEMMLKMVMTKMKDRPGMEMLELLDDNHLMLHLGQSPKLAQIFDRIGLRDIYFDEQWTTVDITPVLHQDTEVEVSETE